MRKREEDIVECGEGLKMVGKESGGGGGGGGVGREQLHCRELTSWTENAERGQRRS